MAFFLTRSLKAATALILTTRGCFDSPKIAMHHVTYGRTKDFLIFLQGGTYVTRVEAKLTFVRDF